MMIWSKFKKFDAHIKTIDGVNQQTLLGAILTVISIAIVLILLISEVTLYLKTDIISRMSTDLTGGIEAVQLEFDVSLLSIPCERIEFHQEVTRGTVHVSELSLVTTVRLHDEETGFFGCQLLANITIDKAGGNFRMSVNGALPHSMGDNLPLSANLSHVINHVAFVPLHGKSAEDKIPGISKNLNKQTAITHNDAGIYQYAIQVIPTQYKTLGGELFFANQYSVVEKSIELDQLRRNEALSGLNLRDFTGIIFTYDFHPVMLIMEERRERLVDFISNLFGILGGVIAMLTLVEGFLHQSSKALIGKKD